jgi:CheY-like chemotaxis protein
MHSYRKAVILLAEDDPGDQELTRRAFQLDVGDADLRIVQDGEEALDYLFRRGRYADAQASPQPDLILLDLNMPRVNGRQVLERLSAHPTAPKVPKVVLTTSHHEDDILRCYALGCNSFISKPAEMSDFLQVIKDLRHYWFELVELPTGLGRGPAARSGVV